MAVSTNLGATSPQEGQQEVNVRDGWKTDILRAVVFPDRQQHEECDGSKPGTQKCEHVVTGGAVELAARVGEREDWTPEKRAREEQADKCSCIGDPVHAIRLLPFMDVGNGSKGGLSGHSAHGRVSAGSRKD